MFMMMSQILNFVDSSETQKSTHFIFSSNKTKSCHDTLKTIGKK